MQIVIDIPNYPNLDDIQLGSIASKVILDAVKHGIVLPKDHGDLVDANLILAELLKIYEGVSRPDLQKPHEFLVGLKTGMGQVLDAEVLVKATEE